MDIEVKVDMVIPGVVWALEYHRGGYATLLQAGRHVRAAPVCFDAERVAAII